MSIAHRISELYAAKMNAVLDRACDRRELADYSYAQLRDLLAEVYRSTARVAVGREHAGRRVGELRHAADRLGVQAAPGAGRGHRTVPHTADLRIEAWAPTREECLAEAVRGLVDSFAVVAARPPGGRARRHLTARLDEDLLVAVIDEVIYRLDADGQIPVSVAVRRAPDGGVVVLFALVPVAEAEITGAVPKAASLHDLRCAPDAAGRWSCAVTVDV